jgi:hypothetical protein
MILVYPVAVVGWKLKESLVETESEATGEFQPFNKKDYVLFLIKLQYS